LSAPPTVSLFEGDGLAGVEPDADRQRKLGVVDRLLHEPFLEIDGRGDALSGRREHRERLVSSELNYPAAARLDGLARDPCKLGGELRGSLITTLLREQGVAADVGDQKALYPRLFGRRLAVAGFVFHDPSTSNADSSEGTGPRSSVQVPHSWTTLAAATRAGWRREMRLLAATTLSTLLKSRSVAAVRRSGHQIGDFRTLMRVVRKEHVAAQEGVTSSTPTLARGRRHAIAPQDPQSQARATLPRVLSHDQADRDAIASQLLRYRDERGGDRANIIDMLTMHPEERRKVARLLGEIDAG
jgi:hypothetical protein